LKGGGEIVKFLSGLGWLTLGGRKVNRVDLLEKKQGARREEQIIGWRKVLVWVRKDHLSQKEKGEDQWEGPGCVLTLCRPNSSQTRRTQSLLKKNQSENESRRVGGAGIGCWARAKGVKEGGRHRALNCHGRRGNKKKRQ